MVSHTIGLGFKMLELPPFTIHFQNGRKYFHPPKILNVALVEIRILITQSFQGSDGLISAKESAAKFRFRFLKREMTTASPLNPPSVPLQK